MRSGRNVLTGFFVVFALLLAACGGSDDTDTAGEGGAATTAAGSGSAATAGGSGAPSGEPILVGVAHDLSGPVGPYGTEMLNGAELAVERFNQAGGLDGRPVELRVEDLASDRARIASAVQKLAGQGVVAVHGPTSSTALVVGAPVAEGEGLVMIAPGSVEKFDEGVLNDWIYRIAPVTAVALPDVLAQMQKASPFTKLAVFYDPANNASVDDLKLLEQLAGSAGFEVVTAETADEGATDFSSQISRISSSGADAIWVSHLVEENAAFMIQARERGLDAPFLGGATFTNRKIFELAGEAGEGSIAYVPFLASSTRPEAAEFVEAFEAAEGKEPDVFAAQGFDAMTALLNGLRAADSVDADSLRQAMENLSFEGATGPVAYDGPGDNTSPGVVLVRVEGGKFVPVEG